jgi:hypothetical protein
LKLAEIFPNPITPLQCSHADGLLTRHLVALQPSADEGVVDLVRDFSVADVVTDLAALREQVAVIAIRRAPCGGRRDIE